MARELLMGNEAIGLGAIRAGVSLVAGYPGTPSTEILETVAKHNQGGAIHVEWSVNEKAALEVAAGASYAGARTLVTMKQVGLNVASDPLMSLAYVGVEGRHGDRVRGRPGSHLFPDRTGHPAFWSILQASGIRPLFPGGGL